MLLTISERGDDLPVLGVGRNLQVVADYLRHLCVEWVILIIVNSDARQIIVRKAKSLLDSIKRG